MRRPGTLAHGADRRHAQGGRALYALDVTNPPDTANPSGVSGGPSFPGYLWEFPCESTNTLCTGTGLPGSRTYAAYMGETWSEPVVTKVKVRIDCTDTATTTCPRYDRWVAIFGAGYDENADPNKPQSATRRRRSTTRATPRRPSARAARCSWSTSRAARCSR